MTKLNLSALKINVKMTDKMQELETEETKIETKNEVEKIEKIDQAPSKKKFSLKELNITGSSNTKKDQNLNQINEVQEVAKKDEEEKTEESNSAVSIQKEDEKIKEVKVLSISDGDTNCNIITEKKVEIFPNYTGSFEKSEKEKSEKIEEVDELNKITQDKSKKTNLQTYQEQKGAAESKKSRSKKVVLTFLITASLTCLLGFFATRNWLIKSNIQETKKENIASKTDNSLVKNQDDARSVISPANTNEENMVSSEKSAENSNQETQDDGVIIGVQSGEFVKENLKNIIDNNDNSNKISEELKDFLIKKYKK